MLKETVVGTARRNTERLGRTLGDARGAAAKVIGTDARRTRKERLLAAAPVIFGAVSRRCRLKITDDGAVQIVVTLIRASKGG